MAKIKWDPQSLEDIEAIANFITSHSSGRQKTPSLIFCIILYKNSKLHLENKMKITLLLEKCILL